ncbi:hypothetical protein A2572_00400 [Candidatus Collierbacteria bacterium RIFOXYD1_FULL_40_9]|uniref:Uncharacterized protein n=1 Tax=Candidatus Collierbacteria bacterium RIFOXYD1_FULL_40_9 TaxID=1817731 RepID=A0A1F5FVB1_9BACT|nr:MAG: hypothetical protein A2572_00400 [Candidatus Collierbacteria bacterium RIFOXYD1_FULL_40_9]
MDLNLLFAVSLIAVVVGLLWGVICLLMYRGTTTLSYTLKERFSVFLLICLITAVFFGFYAVISGVTHYFYYVVAFFGVSTPTALMLLPNWFGIYSKKEETD